MKKQLIWIGGAVLLIIGVGLFFMQRGTGKDDENTAGTSAADTVGAENGETVTVDEGQAAAAGETAAASYSAVKDVVVQTTVRKTGQYPEKFVVTVDDLPKDTKLDAADFHFYGKASKWGDDSLHDLDCGFAEVQEGEGKFALIPDNFPEKFFYVQEWKVECTGDESLSFSSDQVSKVETETADLFETVADEHGFNYHLYKPETSVSVPVVVVFHGYGDTSNLLTYRTAVAWAEPENQKVRPCVVMAPVIETDAYTAEKKRDEVFEGVHEAIEKMAAEGIVSRDRVYVMGNSFGGMSSIEYAEKYPEDTAAVLALCPALSYSVRAVRNLEAMKDVPIWFAHAEHDQTIPASNSERAYEKLVEAGNTEARIRIYTGEEMNAAGGEPSSDSTYSYHHVELAVMEDPEYMEWMFEQSNEE